MTGNFIFNLVEFILIFGFLLFTHEFGHYLMARIFNMEVEEFGLGFPPKIKTLFTYKGTEFTLNAIPFGAFVRPKGENDPDVVGGMAAANPWKRLGVLLGGPMMNLIIGILLYTIFFAQMGTPDMHTVLIGDVSPNSPAQTAGLMPGDIVQSAQGQTITSMEDLQNITSANEGKEMNLVVLRDGQTVETIVIPRINPPEGEGRMGVALAYPYKPITTVQAVPMALTQTWSIITNTVTLPIQLIEGLIPQDEARVVGPVGMFQMFQTISEVDQQAQSSSIQYPSLNVLQFISLISIALGITNLLPIPALDGGRILFIIPELILRKRVPAKYENFVHMIGFTALLLFMAFVTIQDVVNPIQLK